MAVSRVQTSSILQGFPKSRSLLAGNSAYIPSSFESIATAVGTGSSGTITFSSIPSTYKHLQIRCLIKNTRTSSTGNGLTYVTFNADSGSNYAYHNIQGDGSTATANAAASQTAIALTNSVVSSSASYSNIFGTIIVDVLDYANVSKNKTLRALQGTDQNGYGFSILSSGVWVSTSAITSIELTSGHLNWASDSTFALYGIK